MSTEVEEVIKEIAIRHGIAVGRDDPIMVLRTINEILLKDSKEAQAELLNSFKSELEESANRWDIAANDKAQRILNASLDASKNAMATQLEAGVKSSLSEIQNSFELINRSISETRRIAILNMIAAALTITASIVAVFAIIN